MSPSQKKRSSAFEDFPTESGGAGPASPPSSPADTGKGSPIWPSPQPGAVERIERLKPSQMLPDRFQPRRLLPSALRPAFFGGQIDCYQAAAKWLKIAEKDPGYLAEIERLLAMGESFDAYGQIQPVTGSWVPAADGRYIFVIETGERRFWAACLRAVREQSKEEPLLRVEVIEHPTRQRQVLENRHAEPPSAVGQACEVASLVLAEQGISPDPAAADEFDFFRQARSGRMPHKMWEKLEPVMQLTRTRMTQLLNILELPTYLLEVADRYRLPERVLREVLAQPAHLRETLIKQAIKNSLTADDMIRLAQMLNKTVAVSHKLSPASQPRPFSGLPAARALQKLVKGLYEIDPNARRPAVAEMADFIAASPSAGALLELLEELNQAVRARVKRA